MPEHDRRSSKRGRSKEKASGEEDDRLALDSMLDALSEEASSLSPETVRQRLEEYRSPYKANSKLATGDWEALRTNIASSFTQNQLSNYLAETRTSSQGTDGNGVSWRPGTSSFVHTSPGGHGPSPDLRGKPLLAERILRDCWQLSITDEVGQLDIRLPSSFIALLLNAEHFSFDEVASLHRSSIDITRALGLVRITGKQNDCESIHEVILDATARIREADAGIDPQVTADRGQVFGPAFLEWLSKKYGVAFVQNAAKVPEKILYLAETEGRAEDARRTLNLAIHETRPKAIPFSTYLPAAELANVYNYNPESNVSWLDRQKSWFRWAMSSVQAAGSESHLTPFFDSHQTRLSDALLKLLRGASAKQSDQGGVDVHESVTAAVGRCLFMRKPSLKDAAMSGPQLGKLSLPRTFMTEIPRFTKFLDSVDPIPSADGSRTHNLRLIPSSPFAHVAPELDVEIVSKPADIFEDSATSIDSIDVRKVDTILGSNSVDYLLPENGLDLRFTRTTYRRLWDGTTAVTPECQSLLEGIKQSLQDVFASTKTSRDPVPLPPFCHLTLPVEYLQSPAQAGTAIEYLLPPLNDVRGASTQQYDLDGRQLNCRFYETGPFLAARTAEVILGMDIQEAATHSARDESRGDLEHGFHGFYIAACELAFKIHKTRHGAVDDRVDLDE